VFRATGNGSTIVGDMRYAGQAPSMSLTPRMRDILALMAEGKSQREIANELGLSHFTVKNYIEQIYERLGSLDRVQAVSTALRAGLIK
jgi:DNA-binding NarL/FixJ family response regulator